MVSNRNPTPQIDFQSKNLTCQFHAFHFQRMTKGFPSTTVENVLLQFREPPSGRKAFVQVGLKNFDLHREWVLVKQQRGFGKATEF